jgi:hypothetical protein
MRPPFDTEPDFVNELGIRWWKDSATTEYARNPDAAGTVLAAHAWFIEHPNGWRTRVIVSERGEVLAEGQALDDIGMKIDILKFAKREQRPAAATEEGEV